MLKTSSKGGKHHKLPFNMFVLLPLLMQPNEISLPLPIRARGYFNSFIPLGDHLETIYVLVFTHTERKEGNIQKCYKQFSPNDRIMSVYIRML